MNDIDDIKLYAAKNSIPIMRDGGIEFICSYIKEHNIKRILEIGTAIGFSAIEFAKVSPDVKVTTIELDIDRHIKALQNIHDNGLDDRIKAINADALMIDLDDTFDLIFIDAAKGQYTKFFEKFKYFLTKDGTIITDNLKFHGHVGKSSKIESNNLRNLVKKIESYIEFLQDNKEFDTKFYDVGDGLSVSVRHSDDKNE